MEFIRSNSPQPSDRPFQLFDVPIDFIDRRAATSEDRKRLLHDMFNLLQGSIEPLPASISSRFRVFPTDPAHVASVPTHLAGTVQHAISIHNLPGGQMRISSLPFMTSEIATSSAGIVDALRELSGIRRSPPGSQPPPPDSSAPSDGGAATTLPSNRSPSPVLNAKLFEEAAPTNGVAATMSTEGADRFNPIGSPPFFSPQSLCIVAGAIPTRRTTLSNNHASVIVAEWKKRYEEEKQQQQLASTDQDARQTTASASVHSRTVSTTGAVGGSLVATNGGLWLPNPSGGNGSYGDATSATSSSLSPPSIPMNGLGYGAQLGSPAATTNVGGTFGSSWTSGPATLGARQPLMVSSGPQMSSPSGQSFPLSQLTAAAPVAPSNNGVTSSNLAAPPPRAPTESGSIDAATITRLFGSTAAQRGVAPTVAMPTTSQPSSAPEQGRLGAAASSSPPSLSALFGTAATITGAPSSFPRNAVNVPPTASPSANNGSFRTSSAVQPLLVSSQLGAWPLALPSPTAPASVSTLLQSVVGSGGGPAVHEQSAPPAPAPPSASLPAPSHQFDATPINLHHPPVASVAQPLLPPNPATSSGFDIQQLFGRRLVTTADRGTTAATSVSRTSITTDASQPPAMAGWPATSAAPYQPPAAAFASAATPPVTIAALFNRTGVSEPPNRALSGAQSTSAADIAGCVAAGPPSLAPPASQLMELVGRVEPRAPELAPDGQRCPPKLTSLTTMLLNTPSAASAIDSQPSSRAPRQDDLSRLFRPSISAL